jgi:hypothetical protein
MPCEEWSGLLERYRNAVDAYNEAAQALVALPEAAFNEKWHHAERARTKSNSCRADLMHHEHEHVCLGFGQHAGAKRVFAKKEGELRFKGSSTAA